MPDEKWMVQGTDAIEVFDTENEARNELDRIMDDLREHSGEGWHPDTTCVRLYRCTPVAALRLLDVPPPPEWEGEWGCAELDLVELDDPSALEVARLQALLEQELIERGWACEAPCGDCCGCLTAHEAMTGKDPE